jgi:hypothetical protein
MALDEGILSFDEVVTELRSWVGVPVTALVTLIDGGRLCAHLMGILRESSAGAAWSEGDEDEAVAFQVGETAHTYFVLSRGPFAGAEWISREHRFLVVTMGAVQTSVGQSRAAWEQTRGVRES